MSGMGRALQANNPFLAHAFKVDLLRQGLVVLLVAAMIGLAWCWTLALTNPGGAERRRDGEPAGRTLVRIGFGILWLADGLLQMQLSMPIGLPTQVVGPSADGGPHWLVHLVSSGVVAWETHPLQAATAAVWIQVGIGVWFLVAPRGRWSRLAGVAGVGWGLAVWIFGESLGGILAPGASVLFGAPGAAFFYVVAGALVLLPERAWLGERLGTWILRGMGAFFIGMAVLQAWPGRGFWQATGITSMVGAMTGSPQPGFIVGTLNAFSRLVAGSGFATNLAIVVALAAIGVGLMWTRFRDVAVIATLAFWLLDWFLIQDFGLFGGLGTDPNSALPICLLVVGGYLAVLRPAVAQAAPPPQVGTSPPVEPADQEAIDEDGRRPSARSGARPRRVLGVVSVVAAIGVTLLGAVPMAVAAVDRTPSPILAESLQGTGSPMNTLAPPLHLVDQRGRPIGLSDFRGRAVLLTFLDPVCTTDCPIIASEFVQATRMLGSASSRVALVAVVANPIYHSLEDVGAFDRQEGLDRVPNWYFLTGTVSQLRAVWKSYDMQVVVAGGGQMIVHSEVAYVIDPSGHIRWIASDDPGPATTATKESFAALMANDVKRILAPT